MLRGRSAGTSTAAIVVDGGSVARVLVAARVLEVVSAGVVLGAPVSDCRSVHAQIAPARTNKLAAATPLVTSPS